jgi:hypothetical protein
METAFVITRVSWVVTQNQVPFGLEIARVESLHAAAHSQRSRRARATAEVARVFTDG